MRQAGIHLASSLSVNLSTPLVLSNVMLQDAPSNPITPTSNCAIELISDFDD